MDIRPKVHVFEVITTGRPECLINVLFTMNLGCVYSAAEFGCLSFFTIIMGYNAWNEWKNLLWNTKLATGGALEEKVFLEISQNLQENACTRVFFDKVEESFSIKLLPATSLKKRLWHRCFPVNITKFLRTPFLTEHFWATASLKSNESVSVCFKPNLAY